MKDGLEKLKHTEAYEDYGVPYALNIWEKFERLNSIIKRNSVNS